MLGRQLRYCGVVERAARDRGAEDITKPRRVIGLGVGISGGEDVANAAVSTFENRRGGRGTRGNAGFGRQRSGDREETSGL